MAKATTTKSKTAQPAAKAAKPAKADTGSPAVQIGNFTARIKALTKHLQLHKQDHASRRGLLQMVGKRRRLLDYLKRKDLNSYQAVIKKFGLRK